VRVGGGIHQGRFRETIAHGGPEFGQAREVAGEGGRDGDVLVGGLSDKFREVGVGEDGDAGAGEGELAGERDDWNAHPQGVAGGGAAVVGEGVQGDVDAVIGVKVIGDVFLWDEFQAAGGDVLFVQKFGDTILV